MSDEEKIEHARMFSTPEYQLGYKKGYHAAYNNMKQLILRHDHELCELFADVSASQTKGDIDE